MKKFAVIGVYGQGEDFTTGQAVKCFELINWLKKKYDSTNVKVVNTYKWKKHPFKLFFSLILVFINCENVIIMPAQNGLKIFAPLSYYLKKIFKRKVHYVVIGGWLNEVLINNKKLKKYISSFDGVFVETNSMVDKLKKNGMKNSYYLPNCREVPSNIKRKEYKKSEIHKLCTYSRVVKEKGIFDAIEITAKINERLGKNVFQLDIYGKIDNDFKEELEKKIQENSEIIKYCGIKNSNQGVETLSQYYCLLFPTYYEGEGFAGTILDAFAAGTPVIANDWKYNSEIIKNGKNGIIYQYRNIDDATNKLYELYNDVKQYKKIQKGCIEDSKKYTSDYVLSNFIKKISESVYEEDNK